MSDLPHIRRSAFFALLTAALLMFTGCGTTATDTASDTDATAEEAAETFGPVDASSFDGTWSGDCNGTPTDFVIDSDAGTFTEEGLPEGTYTYENELLIAVYPGLMTVEYSTEFSADGNELTLTFDGESSPCNLTRQ